MRPVIGCYLYEMLSFHYGPAVASTHSWHSFRIGQAVALHAAGASDEQIQLICRWVSPESLRLYRRLGFAEMIRLADSAADQHVSTLQMANAPVVDGSEGFALLNQRYGDTAEARISQLLEAGSSAVAPAAPPKDDDAESVSSAGSTRLPEPDARPLAPDNARGRYVLVPRALWPDYPCAELEGRGWLGRICSLRAGVARVAFCHAVDDAGLPFVDVYLRLDALSAF